MAYTQSQTLVDTARRHVLKRVNVANTETSALVVNAAALNCSTSILSLTANTLNFRPGELVNAASGGSGYVQSIVNATAVVLYNATGTWTAATNVTGNVSGTVRVQSGSLAATTKTLQVARVIYDVGGLLESKVQLEWEGTGGGANNRTIAVLSGQGVLELDTHAARVVNNANSATGNIILSTINWTGNTHYTLLLDVSKLDGYENPTMDQSHLGL